MRESRPVPRQPRGNHAVEDVHAAADALDQIIRLANAHQIARSVARQTWQRIIKRLVHFRLSLADSQPADGVTLEIHIGYEARGFLPQVGEDAALYDAKQSLIAVVRMVFATEPQPAMRPFVCRLYLIPMVGIGTLIESHDDVRAQIPLDLHGAAGRQSSRAAVQMAAEGDAVGVNPVDFAQAEYLESAGIGQERTVPAHEIMQAAQIAHEFVARAQVQVVGVGKDQLDIEVFEVARGHCLDGSRRAYRREYRCGDVSVRGMQDAGSRIAIGRDYLKFESHSVPKSLSLTPVPCSMTDARCHADRRNYNTRVDGQMSTEGRRRPARFCPDTQAANWPQGYTAAESASMPR